MGNRQRTLLWMKDLTEHMAHCLDQLHWAADGPGESFLTEALLSDLAECRRLCEQLRTRPRRGAMAAAR